MADDSDRRHPRRRWSLGVAAGVVVLLALTACSSNQPYLLPTDAPQEVRARSRLPACGSESTVSGGGANTAGRYCFWGAYLAGRPAEFITTRPSVEGDPITWIYCVLGKERVEVFVDVTHDLAGLGSPPRWVRLDCDSLDLIDEGATDFGPGTCDDVDLR